MDAQTQTTSKALPYLATRLLQSLETPTGKSYGLTSRQIRARYGVKNPRDLVYRLRQNGYPVVTEETVLSNGTVRMKYFLD